MVYHFPQKTAPAVLAPDERGIASISHPDVGTFRFRSNPKQFNWSYTLNKRIDQTYGGRVVQLLGTRIEDFSFTADCGGGRWAEMNRVALFMRDVMISQRNGRPATFEYTTRGWKFNAYVVSIPFSDAVEEVLREFTVSMKVQEDVSGVMSQNTLQAELRRLQDGVGFQRSKYNDPQYGNNTSLVPNSEEYQNVLLDNVAGVTQAFTNVLLNPNFIGADALTGNNLTSTLLGAAGGQTTGGN
jgi:hypothetical protein